jgi:hypothetical protein
MTADPKDGPAGEGKESGMKTKSELAQEVWASAFQVRNANGCVPAYCREAADEAKAAFEKGYSDALASCERGIPQGLTIDTAEEAGRKAYEEAAADVTALDQAALDPKKRGEVLEAIVRKALATKEGRE